MQTTNTNGRPTLPMSAMKDIPTPKADAAEIVALVKQGGRVTGYKLSDGQVLDKQQAVELARQGGIKGVGISTNRGTEYLKSLPDYNEGNNLGNMPSITLGNTEVNEYGNSGSTGTGVQREPTRHQ